MWDGVWEPGWCGRQNAGVGRRIGETGEDAVPAGVEQTQAIRGFRISGRRRAGPFFEGRSVIRALVSVTAALHCRPGPTEADFFRQSDHGSRIASLRLRITPLSKYMKTERDPTLMSAISVIPGMRRKLSGIALSLTSVNAIRAL